MREKTEVKKELKNSLTKRERYEIKELNEKANKAEKCKAGVSIIRAYKEIIKKKRTLYTLLLDKVLFFKSLKRSKTKKHAHQRRKI